MRTAEKLLICALFLLFPVYIIAALFPHESSVFSSRDFSNRVNSKSEFLTVH